MGQIVLVVATAGLTIYCLVDCLRTPEADLRGMPKPLWLVVILLLQPFLGGALWLVFGNGSTPGHAFGRQPRIIAPDDDPEFLRTLGARRRRRDDDPA